MSIKNDLQHLESIENELKRLTLKSKSLRKEKKKITERITNYLKEKDAPGIKHQGIAVVVEEKQERIKTKKAQKDDNTIEILKQYGIPNPEKVLTEILESRKGELDPIPKPKLKIKKYAS